MKNLDRKSPVNIRLLLIIEGILPATSDFSDQYCSLLTKYPKILDIATIFHEYRETLILYNKKYKILVDKCKKKSDNQIEFGKLLGYTEQIDLRKEANKPFGLYYDKCIGINFVLNNEIFLGYWKFEKNTDMKKELKLLNKMRTIDNKINLEISYIRA
jgi:hypothetical protein